MTELQSGVHQVRFGTSTARIVLLVTILSSGMAFLDGTIVNVALPRIEADLGGGLATLQWVLNAYMLTLGALVLVGGSLGDLLGIRRVFGWGVVGFTITSLMCALAPSAGWLVAGRALQGVSAALMVPGSLALISSLFVVEERGRAIGLWSGLSGVATALGPFIGGLLVDTGDSGWRWAFLAKLPLAVIVLLLLPKVPSVPGRRTDAPLGSQLDLLGAFLTTAGLALLVAPLTEAERLGTPLTVALTALGAAFLVGFWVLERRRQATGQPAPMMPPSLWRIRSFTVANVVTFVVYGALSSVMFLLTLALMIGLGWSALVTGLATLPMTIMLALFSGKVGSLVPRFGARPLLTAGCVLMAVGMFMLAYLPPDPSYWTEVFPGVMVFSVGMTLIVAPITTTALGDIPVAASGVGSGVNNAVARIGGLVTVAVIPVMAGLAGTTSDAGLAVLSGYNRATIISAGVCAVGAVVSWFGFHRDTGKEPVRDVATVGVS
ncbi:MAG: MFS transporter [Candidatus Nanopelagicales bacterium]